MALSIKPVMQGEIGRLIVERSLLSGSENQHPIFAIYLTIGQFAPNNIIWQLSRVDRFLPMLQVEVCFLRLPPSFPAVPQYFNHTPVGPGPSQNRTCGFPASGSSNRLTD
jgi:hypothetical protein